MTITESRRDQLIEYVESVVVVLGDDITINGNISTDAEFGKVAGRIVLIEECFSALRWAGVYSASNLAPVGTPAAAATATAGELTVTFTAATGGTTPYAYTVTVIAADQSESHAMTGLVVSYTFTGLRSGAEYNVRIGVTDNVDAVGGLALTTGTPL